MDLVTKSCVCSLLTTMGKSGRLGFITLIKCNHLLLINVHSLALISYLWPQKAVCPRSRCKNELIISQDLRGSGA